MGGRGRGDEYVRSRWRSQKLNRTQREALQAFENTLKEENYEQRKGFLKI